MLSNSQFHDLVSGRWTGIAPALLRTGLALLEPIYGWFVRRKNRGYDTGRSTPRRVGVPVISIGNLTVGGTGKTPLVCWLGRWFQSQEVAITLISRGYGVRNGQPNDEALELAARLPGVRQLQNPDRIAAARQAEAENPRQIILLDDAFQHRRLARDLDIVLLDALAPFGYDRLLPRGLLREPVESLARAQVIGLSRADAITVPRRQAIRERVRKLAPEALWLELVHQPRELISASGIHRPLTHLRGRRIVAFCGIGNPMGFWHTIESLHSEVVAQWAFPDHEPYSPQFISTLEAKIRHLPQIDALLCTHKDLVKIQRDEIAGVPLFALQVEMEITAGRDDLEQMLRQLAQFAPAAVEQPKS